ncbi:MAG: hypothetical protein JOZ39_06130 [Chloroflexi bacterium]|nr:hypothetical protein [Chloroflexota bacterium]
MADVLGQEALETQAAAAQRPMPDVAPPLQNPPATMEQIQAEDAARAAIGGTAQARRVTEADVEDFEGLEPEAAAPEAAPRSRRPRNRFEPPQELPFEYTPPERQEIRNNNVPLTIGLLLSIVASFLVFIISLAGGTAGSDPIMPSFWRALGALAVLTTLSFAASWFMPAPSDHRKLLDQIEAEDRLTDDRLGRSRRSAGPAEEAFLEEEEEDRGVNLDVTLDDDLAGAEDELAGAEDDEDETEDDDFDDEDEDAGLATITPGPAATGRDR